MFISANEKQLIHEQIQILNTMVRTLVDADKTRSETVVRLMGHFSALTKQMADLKRTQCPDSIRPLVQITEPVKPKAKKRRRGRTWTPEQRQVQSERMRVKFMMERMAKKGEKA
jgi:RNase P subunit RPR2